MVSGLVRRSLREEDSFGLVRMWLHDLLRHMPTGTQWSLCYWECDFMISEGTCQLDTMIFGLVRMWFHDLLRHMPTGHNDLCANENVTLGSLKAHANWPTGHNDVWAGENVKVCNSEFPPWNFFWLSSRILIYNHVWFWVILKYNCCLVVAIWLAGPF